MTNKPKILPNPGSQQRLVLFVAFPGMCMLDMAGPQTVFWSACRRLGERGSPEYRRHTVSLEGGLVQTLEGVPMHTQPLSDFADEEIDTIIVPGSPHIEQVIEHSGLLIAWLREASRRARRTTSVCSGAFMLAQAGLLDGKRAATHWAMSDRLEQVHPSVATDRDAIFVQQGNVWTSAGVTAGIDLSLALVEADCGRQLALQVARELVVFVKRPGGQAQFSSLLQAQLQDGMIFDELHLWITDNLGSDGLTVDALAARASMSPRNFARVYKEKTGRTPAKAVEIFRLEAARRLLEESDKHIEQVARQCGFGDEDRMRITFQRNLGISPSEYRNRFSSQASAALE
jgi:transcriptional regulator GlxA family with amidase domain